MLNATPLINVTRGSLTECIHRGHVAVVNAAGQLLYSAGNPHYRTYARSTAKLLQVLPLFETGAAQHYRFTPAEIAVMCASHNGEPEHTEAVQSILSKLHLDQDALLCGIHEPYHRPTRRHMLAAKEAATTLHNNCSGKHAAMLALARYNNHALTAYNEPDHPVQQMIIETIAAMAQVKKDQIGIGIDGCGVPVFALHLNELALAYARLGVSDMHATERATACQQIIAALAQHPFLIAGSDRFDTRLIEITAGRIIGKMGAEGVFAVTIPSLGIGIALKIEDGSERALYPAVVETLKQLSVLNEAELAQLSSFHTPPILNRNGVKVGAIEPAFTLTT